MKVAGVSGWYSGYADEFLFVVDKILVVRLFYLLYFYSNAGIKLGYHFHFWTMASVYVKFGGRYPDSSNEFDGRQFEDH